MAEKNYMLEVGAGQHKILRDWTVELVAQHTATKNIINSTALVARPWGAPVPRLRGRRGLHCTAQSESEVSC